MTTTAAEQMQEIWEATAKERAQDKAKEQAKAKAKAKRHARYIAQRYATSFARSAERQRMGRPPICRDLVIESHGIDGKASQHDSIGALASAVRPRIERSIEQVLNADVQTTREARFPRKVTTKKTLIS